MSVCVLYGHFRPTWMAVIKKAERIESIAVDMKSPEASHTAGGHGKWSG